MALMMVCSVHFVIQMLFYESSKCLHGRMKVLKGLHYGSIFLHYKPADSSIWDFSVDVRVNYDPLGDCIII